MSGPRIEVDTPESFAARARWTLETLLSACASPTAEAVRYGQSGGLEASEQAWRYFETAGAAPPLLGEGGMVDYGDHEESAPALSGTTTIIDGTTITATSVDGSGL